MLKRILALFVGIIISINCIACTGVDKENILLNDVKSQSKVEQQEINTAIENGNRYLQNLLYNI